LGAQPRLQPASTLLRSGERLKIPFRGTEGLPPLAHRIGITHVVTTGDTLWGLARRYRVTISQLAKWNAIPTAKPLIPGQKLVIRPLGNT